MYCNNCGKQVPDHASFCPGCGAKRITGRRDNGRPDMQANVQTANVQPKNVQPNANSYKQPKVSPERVPEKITVGKSRKRFWGKPRKVRKKLPAIAAFLLGILLCVALVAGMTFGGLVKFNLQTSAGSEMIEGTGYDSPEAAATAYLEAMKAGDVDAMLSTFAVESYVDHYSLASNILRTSAFVSNYAYTDKGVIDTEDSLKSELNIGIREGDLLGDIWCQYVYNTLDENSEAGQAISEMKAYQVTDAGEAQSVILALQGEGMDFSTLEVGAPVYGEVINDSFLTSQSLWNMYKSSAYVYGAEAYKSLGMTFTVDGKEGLLFMDTVKYGGKWYNLDLNGYLGTLLGLSSQTAGMRLSDRNEWSELGLGDVYTSSQNGQALAEFRSSVLPEMEAGYKEAVQEALYEFVAEDFEEAYASGQITEDLLKQCKSVSSAEDMTECNREICRIAFSQGYDGPEMYQVLTWDEFIEYFSFTELG